MDELSAELGRSKSNIFANLRGLEAAGIVEHHQGGRLPARPLSPARQVSGRRHRGLYHSPPARGLGQARLVRESREILGDARTPEAMALRQKLDGLGGTYDRFAELFEVLPAMDGPLDLEAVIVGLPKVALDGIVVVLRKALGFAATRATSSKR